MKTNLLSYHKYNSYISDFKEILKKSILEIHENIWLCGILNVIESQHYMKVIFEDINICLGKINKESKILDFGCGCGVVGYVFARLGYDVECIDIDNFEEDKFSHFKMAEQQVVLWNHLSQNHHNLKFKHYCNSVPYKDNTFDITIAYAVIEHVPTIQLKNVISEIKRVTKNNSYLYISRLPRTLSYIEFLAKVFKIPAHDKLYSKNEIRNLLLSNSINVLYFDITDFIPSYPAKIINRLYFILEKFESIILKSPLKYLAHHQRILAIIIK